MMPAPLTIHVLSDGKPGHQNQSLGLTDALGRLTPVRVERIPLEGVKGFIARGRKAFEGQRGLPAPDLIVGAGHATHPSLILLSRKSGAPSVVLMKPSLPRMFFDLCLIPAHDLPDGETPADIIRTLGALNRVPPHAGGTKAGKILLIGGPSSSHGWDEEGIVAMVRRITAGSAGWEATDSRRTPAGTLAKLAAACPGLATFPHAETGSSWLPEKLAVAGQAWVTEDSVSMIYEALSSGAATGVLPVPVTKPRSRVVRGLRQLIADGYVTRFEDWQPGSELLAPPRILREADRCARIVLERFFPHLLPA